jgi:hypothetical protein
MQISKSLAAIGLIAFASLISGQAQDNPAQAAARAALMEQMNGSSENAQPAETPPPVLIDSNGVVNSQINSAPTNSPAAPAPAEIQPPVIPPPSMAATPANENSIAPAAGDTEAQAKAREALMQTMSESNPPPVETPAPAPMVAPARNNVVTPLKPAPPMVAPPVVAPPSPPANYPGKSLGLQPIVAPPLPISMTKEEQLQALDAKYKANQISPQDYFKQREAIIGQMNSTNQ